MRSGWFRATPIVMLAAAIIAVAVGSSSLRNDLDEANSMSGESEGQVGRIRPASEQRPEEQRPALRRTRARALSQEADVTLVSFCRNDAFEWREIDSALVRRDEIAELDIKNEVCAILAKARGGARAWAEVHDPDQVTDVRFPKRTRVTGAVIDARTRLGVPRVTVRLSPHPSTSMPGLSEHLATTATTTEGGEFVFEDVSEGHYHLFAEAAGVGRSERTEHTVPHSGLLTLEFQRIGHVDGFLLLPSGRGTSGTVVLKSADLAFREQYAVDQMGAFVFSVLPGQYLLQGLVEHGTHFVEAPVSVESETTTSVRLVASPTFQFSGRIVSTAGEPIAGAQVRAFRERSSSPVAETISTASGSFHLFGIPAGSTRIAIHRAGSASVSELVTLDRSVSEALFVLSSTQTLSGRVLNIPRAGRAVVTLHGAGSSRSTMTDGAGTFSFTEVPQDKLLTLTASISGLPTAKVVQWHPGQSSFVEIALPDTVSVIVDVTACPGRAWLQPLAGKADGSPIGLKPGARGEYELASGMYRIVVVREASVYQSSAFQIDSARRLAAVNCEKDEVWHRKIHGVVHALGVAAAGVTVVAELKDGRLVRSFTDDRGHFEMAAPEEDLAHVMAWRTGWIGKSVDSSSVIHLEPPAALSGRISAIGSGAIVSVLYERESAIPMPPDVFRRFYGSTYQLADLSPGRARIILQSETRTEDRGLVLMSGVAHQVDF